MTTVVGIGEHLGVFQRSDLGVTHDVKVRIGREQGGIGHTDDLDVMGVDDVFVHVIVRIGAEELQRVVLWQQGNEL